MIVIDNAGGNAHAFRVGIQQDGEKWSILRLSSVV